MTGHLVKALVTLTHCFSIMILFLFNICQWIDIGSANMNIFSSMSNLVNL